MIIYCEKNCLVGKLSLKTNENHLIRINESYVDLFNLKF